MEEIDLSWMYVENEDDERAEAENTADEHEREFQAEMNWALYGE